MGVELGMVTKMARSRLIIRNGRRIMSVTSFIITKRKINQEEEEEEVEEEEVIEVVEVINLSLIKMAVEEVEVEETIITRDRSSNSSISRTRNSILFNNKYALAILSSIIIMEITSNNNNNKTTAIRTVIINTIIIITKAKDINNRSIKKSNTTRKKGLKARTKDTTTIDCCFMKSSFYT